MSAVDAVIVFLALTMRLFVYQSFNVPSVSMDPALPYHSYFMASKSSYGYGVPFTNIRFLRKYPERGDVVLYYFDSGSGVITMVKRVVGIPSDTVQLKDGTVYLNGQALGRKKILDAYEPRQAIYDNTYENDRRYALYRETLPNGRSYRIVEEADTDNALDTTELFKVPAGHYFLMGDNRDNSRDSRVSVVGFIPEDQIYAKAAFIYWDESVQKFLYAPVE
jgi:signal peptidase I